MQTLSYDQISSQLEEWASTISCSEIHGLISGLGSVALVGNYTQVEKIVLRHLDESECSEQAQDALRTMQEAVLEQFEDIDFAFEVLLPDDDEELQLRIHALAQWCQGFLVGFGTGVKASEMNFSPEAQEVLRDLIEISNVAEELEQDGAEEDEVAFTELTEYVRTAAMMLYSEFGLEKQTSSTNDSLNDGETFH
jgi:uncharacterized protein YgfB (UPF0149 family)